MIITLVLFICSISISIQSMEKRASYGQLRQRASTTVSSNRLTRSTSGNLERVGQAIKKSTSASSLFKLSKVSKKSDIEHQTNTRFTRPPKHPKKTQFADKLFINQELLALTNCYNEDAENAVLDGDASKFLELYKKIDSPRAKQELLAKATQLRSDDLRFSQAISQAAKP